MKQIILIICLACAGLFTEPMELLATPSVVLRGSLMGMGRMSVGPKISPVEVYQNPTNVETFFSRNLGYLNIIVVNQYGYPVYQSSVNATNGSKVTIDTRGWNSGGYTIKIINEENRCVEGDFVIN